MKKNNKPAVQEAGTTAILYTCEWGTDDVVEDLLDAIKKDDGIGVFRTEREAVEQALRASEHIGPIRVVPWTITKGKRPAKIERHLLVPNPKGPGYKKTVLSDAPQS